MPTQTLTATNAESSVSAPAPRSLGRYILTAPLGAGSMGSVYRGHVRGKPGDGFALKVVSEDSKHIRELKREFRQMSGFRHPNLVRLYEIVEADDHACLVMELIEGKEFGDAPSGDASQLEAAVGQLASGVAALHQAGHLHRDLKPSNVLIEHTTGRVVILDFGLLHQRQGSRVNPNTTWGTPRYMAPELRAGGEPTVATDWFAVGAMLWQSLMGEVPTADGAQAMGVALREKRDVPGHLKALCLGLIEPDPNARLTGEKVLSELGVDPQVPSNPTTLIGRARELDACLAAWNQVAAIGTQVLWLEGESGIGKTRLADATIERIQAEADVWVLRSRCFASERIPYRAIDGLIEHLGALCEENLELLQPDFSAHEFGLLARLFPTLRTFASFDQVADAPVSQELRSRAIVALEKLLRLLSKIRPLVLFLDDVQWGDRDSAQVLGPLLSGARDARILMLCTSHVRTDTSALVEDDGFESTLKFIAGDSDGAWSQRTRVLLEPLDEQAASELFSRCGHTPQPNVQVLEQAAGNPLLIQRAAQLSTRSDPDEPAESLWTSSLHHMSNYGPLLSLLAISPSPLPLGTALAVANVDIGAARALADLQSAGLASIAPYLGRTFNADPNEDRLYLVHAQLRDAVLKDVDVQNQAGLHNRLADALAARDDAHPAILATHYHAGGRLEVATQWAQEAGLLARTSLAFDAAAGHYRDALEWGASAGTHDKRQRSDLNEKLANALFDGGLLPIKVFEA